MSRQLSVLLQQVFPSEQRWKLALFEQWGTIVGRLKDHARIEKIYDTVIIIGVSHPVWAQELQMLSGMLKEKINLVIGQERIKTIRFSMISSQKPNPIQKAESAKDTNTFMAPPEPVTLSTKQQQLLTTIANPQLRESIARYMLLSGRIKKSKRKG